MSKRQQSMVKIIKYLHAAGCAKSVEELATECDVCESTIRKYLKDMASRHKIYFTTKPDTNIELVVLMADNCKEELYQRIDIGEYLKSIGKG